MAAVIGYNGLGLVEWDLWDWIRPVADCPVHCLDRPVGELAGAGDIAGAIQLHAFGAEPNNVAVLAEDFDWTLQEVDGEFVGCALGVAHGVLFQGLAH